MSVLQRIVEGKNASAPFKPFHLQYVPIFSEIQPSRQLPLVHSGDISSVT